MRLKKDETVEEMALEEEKIAQDREREKEVRSLSDLLSGRREWLLLAVTLALILVLGYTVRDIFSPILVYVVFLIATYPLRHESMVRHILLIATLLFGVWFFVEVSGAVLPFVIAFLISFKFLANYEIDILQHIECAKCYVIIISYRRRNEIQCRAQCAGLIFFS